MKIQNNMNLSQYSNLDAVAIPAPKVDGSKLRQLFDVLPFNFRSKKAAVAILPLTGVIAKSSGVRPGLNLESLNPLIEKAFEKTKLSALCLAINSPGGSPVQSELIASRIRSLAKKHKVPVYSFVEDVAASGGYWLACAGDEIYASKGSIIGSIGVISSGFGFHEAINKLGIERRVYTEGKNKSILDPFLPEKPNDIKIIKTMQKNLHEYFISYVKERRGGKLTQSDDILFNGEFWAGSTALDFGLIDGIEDIYHFINRKFGDDAKIEYITLKKSWIKNKIGMYSKNIMQEFSEELIDSFENKLKSKKFEIY
jgi:signal peptide peptidase SppA